MSSLNLQNDLFLGLQELQRQNKFIKSDGFVRLFKSIMNNFGIVNVDSDSSFDNFKVQSGTNTGTVKISSDSYAIDNDLNVICQKAVDNVSVTDDSNWYWMKVSYEESSIEEGVISISTDGTLTGTNTKFSEVLRDQSNYPVKICFPGSTYNTGDYVVASILSDTQAILSNSAGFTAESDLEYQVIGSFTPGINPTGNDRFPYVYDGCNLEFVLETVSETAPSKTDGNEFYIARVRNVSGTVTVQDKRTEFCSPARTNAGWIEPSLNIEFVNDTGKEVSYRKNYLGEVEIKGSFTTSDGEATIFTLPEGYRPPYTVRGIYTYSDGSVIRLIEVLANGEVQAVSSFAFHETNINEIVSLIFKTE
jgi:hypothetical protein